MVGSLKSLVVPQQENPRSRGLQPARIHIVWERRAIRPIAQAEACGSLSILCLSDCFVTRIQARPYSSDTGSMSMIIRFTLA